MHSARILIVGGGIGGILLALSTTIFGGIGGYLMRVYKSVTLGPQLQQRYNAAARVVCQSIPSKTIRMMWRLPAAISGATGSLPRKPAGRGVERDAAVVEPTALRQFRLEVSRERRQLGVDHHRRRVLELQVLLAVRELPLMDDESRVDCLTIKFARRATGRNRILYASSAFHGLTTGALSLNGSEVFREGFGPQRLDLRYRLGVADEKPKKKRTKKKESREEAPKRPPPGTTRTKRECRCRSGAPSGSSLPTSRR